MNGPGGMNGIRTLTVSCYRDSQVTDWSAVVNTEKFKLLSSSQPSIHSFILRSFIQQIFTFLLPAGAA